MVTDKRFLSFDDGIFKPYFEKFILYKRSKGQKVAHSALCRMGVLNNMLNSYGVLEVTKEIAEEILAPREDVSKFTRNERITLLRQFLAFVKLLGIECYQIPLRYTRAVHCDFRPYIFSDTEIIRLVSAADTMQVRKYYGKDCAPAYQVMTRLLIGTGMRIGEVLAAKRTDVDLENGVFKVINGKNGVSRYIPMADSLTDALRIYMSAESGNSLLFPSPETGKVYDYCAIRVMFRKLFTAAEIYKTDGTTPNIHSLRHTFCSKSLEQLLASGLSMYAAIPILAAYVGHVNYRDTEAYIHFTENGYKELLNKQEPLRKLIPGVKYNGR
jgi:integrase